MEVVVLGSFSSSNCITLLDLALTASINSMSQAVLDISGVRAISITIRLSVLQSKHSIPICALPFLQSTA